MFYIWKERNSRIFDKVSPLEMVIVDKIMVEWRMWKLAWSLRARNGQLVGETET